MKGPDVAFDVLGQCWTLIGPEGVSGRGSEDLPDVTLKAVYEASSL